MANPAFVPVEDFVRGTVPDVSVVSGEPTTHRVPVVTAVPEDHGPTESSSEVLQRLLALVKSRLGQPVVLVGRVPMTEDEGSSHRRRRMLTRVAIWAGAVTLVLSAAASAPWSPVVAVIASGAIVTGLVTSNRLRKVWPGGSLDRDRAWVTLVPVHPDFVIAARERYGTPFG